MGLYLLVCDRAVLFFFNRLGVDSFRCEELKMGLPRDSQNNPISWKEFDYENEIPFPLLMRLDITVCLLLGVSHNFATDTKYRKVKNSNGSVTDIEHFLRSS